MFSCRRAGFAGAGIHVWRCGAKPGQFVFSASWAEAGNAYLATLPGRAPWLWTKACVAEGRPGKSTAKGYAGTNGRPVRCLGQVWLALCGVCAKEDGNAASDGGGDFPRGIFGMGVQ